MADITSLGHTHGETSGREPVPLYENRTGARLLRLVPVPAVSLSVASFLALHYAGAGPEGALLYGAALGAALGLVFFIAVRIAVLPRARLRVYERVFETRSRRLKHQGMHIVSVEPKGSYVFVTMETGEVHAVLTGEPQKAREALLELRKRARET
jgi:hypothetical protein